MPYKEKSWNFKGTNREKMRSSLVDIGEKNVGNWEALRRRHNFSSDADFVEYLLLLAEKYLSSNSVTINENRWDKNDPTIITDCGKTESSEDDVDEISHQDNRLSEDKNHSEITSENEGRGDVPITSEGFEEIRKSSAEDSRDECLKTDGDQPEDGIEVLGNEDLEGTRRNRKKKFRAAKKRKVRERETMIVDGENRDGPKSCGKTDEHKIEDKYEKSASSPGNKVCQFCDTSHPKDSCPLFRPSSTISDSCIFSSGTKVDHATASLPDILEMKEKDTKGTLGIFARVRVSKYTQFGPLVGVSIKEMEITDDSSMKDIWEVNEGTYLSTSDPEKSNWIRWLCPAPTRHDRNVVPLEREGKLYFVTTTPIESGSEVFFWAEMNGPWAFKKMERTSCGGCNLHFEHPMYYRTHCAVFHEASLSLTVRKYHCKVCGKAVLGKQNIMKHALLYHEGKGAYQCQFCSKFFLRLNYLEMHRNYGCSANPHRARPLCDYCGRKFCQPQKLKVHIKRMHSDLAEVLHEFQCRDCLKILGSRAALQRHTKEVHKRPSGVSCSKCSKTFQNKSNLKIHMLTHSGVKPFQCQEGRCSAAFTTKQCLQFHYKKVHGLSEDRFPSIVRSVEYTFESYAGVRDAALDSRDIDDNQDTSDSLQMDNGGESSAEDNRSSRLIVVDGEDDTNPSTGPTCEETSVIEYHSSSTTVNKGQDLGETNQLSGNINHASRDNLTGVIMSGQSSSASLLVEAALESAENELCRSLPAPSPPPPPLPPSDSPVPEVSPDERHIPEIVIPSYGELRRASPPPTPHYVSVMYDGVKASTSPITSPQQVTYLSPRYERHYLSPPPPHEFIHEERRYHKEEMAQNLTKYKYEEARVMYHELIPRYPIATTDYYPWEVLRPALNLQTSVDLSASTGHLPPVMEQPPSPPYQPFHVPQKSPVYHHYTSYY